MNTNAMNRIIRNTFLAALNLCLMTSLLASCEVNETLCEKDHPHKSAVKFKYSWDKMPASVTDYPYQFYIIADRVINTKAYAFSFNTRADDGNGQGHYIDPLPENIAEEENVERSEFEIASGEYKFLTMNYGRTFEEKIDPSRIVTADYVITPNPLKLKAEDLSLRLGTFNIEYRTYDPYTSADENASEEEKEAKRAKFIRNVTDPIVIDSTTIRWIGNDETSEVEFHPTPITQNVDLYFDLKKKQTSTFQFFVSDVWCVLSGIPRRMNVGTGAVDVSQTDKLIFQTKLVDPDKVPDSNSEELHPQGWPSEQIVDNIGKYDNQSETTVRCYANLNIPGIVENTTYTDANKYAGPGVLQIIVKVWVYEENVNDNRWGWRSHTIMGRVNLHKNIERAQLLELYDENGQQYWRKAQDHKTVHLAIDATLNQSLILGTDESPRVANWEEEQHIEEEF